MSVCKAELSGQPFSQTLSCQQKSWANFDVIAPTLRKQLAICEEFVCVQRGVCFQMARSL